jgi:hypothetical protein
MRPVPSHPALVFFPGQGDKRRVGALFPVVFGARPKNWKEHPMEELVARISAAAGLDAGMATKAIGMILNFLNKEGPAAEVSQLIGALPGAAEAMAAAQGGGGLMGGLAGMMPGGGGVMGLGAQMMGAGLSMGQIQTVGKEMFAYGREQAGEDAMGAIVGAIPGLSQFV